MEPSTSRIPTAASPGYCVQELPASALVIQLKLELVDRLLPEVMAGFGALPRRGAEVGGVLLGHIEPGMPTTIWVDDFEAVPCQHRHGPSYVLSESDLALFRSAVQECSEAGGEFRAVGFYRSHTREEETLGAEDLTLCAELFPPPHGIVLVVRPFATKASLGGFVSYGGGALAAWPAEMFPFRRVELEGGAPPPRKPLAESRLLVEPAPELPESERRSNGNGTSPRALESHTSSPGASFSFGGYITKSDATVVPQEKPRTATRSGPSAWLWAALSFFLLAIGLALGFAAARNIGPTPWVPSPADPYNLGLTATLREDRLLIAWNRDSSPVQRATGGRLIISEGGISKTVQLGPGELRNGTVVYHSSGGPVSIQLDASLNERSVVTEAINWKP